jgi:hypothetical protein
MSIRYVILYFVTAFGFALSACSSETEMRSQLLEKTPRGASFNQVLQYCAINNLKCFQSNNAGYLNQDSGEVVGVKSIWSVIDEHQEAPLKKASISAYWGFDANSRLIDIWVWKTVDAP